MITLSSKTGDSLKVLSNIAGQFRLRDLPPGQYDVKVEAEGFAPVEIKNVDVRLGKSVNLDVLLKARIPPAKSVSPFGGALIPPRRHHRPCASVEHPWAGKFKPIDIVTGQPVTGVELTLIPTVPKKDSGKTPSGQEVPYRRITEKSPVKLSELPAGSMTFLLALIAISPRCCARFRAFPERARSRFPCNPSPWSLQRSCE